MERVTMTATEIADLNSLLDESSIRGAEWTEKESP